MTEIRCKQDVSLSCVRWYEISINEAHDTCHFTKYPECPAGENLKHYKTNLCYALALQLWGRLCDIGFDSIMFYFIGDVKDYVIFGIQLKYV